MTVTVKAGTHPATDRDIRLSPEDLATIAQILREYRADGDNEGGIAAVEDYLAGGATDGK